MQMISRLLVQIIEPKTNITKEHWTMQKQHLDGNEADDEKSKKNL